MDFDKLLEPLGEDSPTGNDLRYVDGDLTFQQIEEHRVDEDPALVIEGEPKTANWPGVVRVCSEALESKTKDLEIVGWLAEGLAHTEGFSGVRDGLRLAKEMLRTFWDRLHPGFDDGEIILPIRGKPLAWLGNPRCFLVAVKSIPIATGHPGRALTWGDYEMADRVDEAQATGSETYKDLTDAGYVSGETWNLAISNTAAGQLEETLESVRACTVELEELVKECNERFGDDEAPILVELDSLLGDIRDFIQRKVQPAEVLGEGDEALNAEAGATGPVVAGGPIRTRQDALRQLDQVAQFFRQTEPHSPISHLVQRAVRWGAMPLEDLLREIVKNSDALEHIWETLGLEGSQSGGGDSDYEES